MTTVTRVLAAPIGHRADCCQRTRAERDAGASLFSLGQSKEYLIFKRVAEHSETLAVRNKLSIWPIIWVSAGEGFLKYC